MSFMADLLSGTEMGPAVGFIYPELSASPGLGPPPDMLLRNVLFAQPTEPRPTSCSGWWVLGSLCPPALPESQGLPVGRAPWAEGCSPQPEQERRLFFVGTRPIQASAFAESFLF